MPAKVLVDFNKCTGHARCAIVAPEVYELDDNGFNDMGAFTVAEGQDGAARRGARSCPERAITFMPDDTAADANPTGWPRATI